MSGSIFVGVRAVLFDLDGTLLDSAPDLGAAADALRVRHGLPSLPLSAYRAHAGSGARGMLRVAFDIGPENDRFDEHKREFFDLYEQCLFERTRAFEGVDNVISALQTRRVPWGVVTNKSQRFTLPLTDTMPLFAQVGAIVCGDTTPYTKPHPEPVLEGMRRLGMLPEQCVYVGDDLRDIQAGRAAGMRTIAATYGYLGLGADVDRWEADALATSPMDLLKLLELA